MHAFTDSTTVLSWIANHPKKWHTFVANRVNETQQVLPFEFWHHFSSHDNAADCASRGIQSSDLTNHALWWHGHTWLQVPDYSFSSPRCNDECALTEARKDVMAHHVSLDISLLDRFSSLTKLKRKFTLLSFVGFDLYKEITLHRKFYPVSPEIESR
ncbi:unnamed protein product [Allacma fusca]|uniref:Uncharacterized protein n=1 Tax=Allacma fusca TaxID=39272 RepID=A0A8J2NQN9_9HEXA|nr:unnamed protein product [Allacma fusca]